MVGREMMKVVRCGCCPTFSSPISPPKPANTLNDYDITDRVSGDSTDDERAPKKRIATWAQSRPF